jgi:hypothetical protein
VPLICPEGTRGVSEDELDHMMAIMDADGNGTVSFVEFENWWASLGWEAVKMDDPEAGEPVSSTHAPAPPSLCRVHSRLPVRGRPAARHTPAARWPYAVCLRVCVSFRTSTTRRTTSTR